jgi:hypothetical protein
MQTPSQIGCLLLSRGESVAVTAEPAAENAGRGGVTRRSYDPTGVAAMGTVKATPLLGCSSWGGAIKVAHRLSNSAKASEGLEDADFWHAAAEKLLSPFSTPPRTRVARWLT